jgi:quercetin dioxygenase-like cupin family protein
MKLVFAVSAALAAMTGVLCGTALGADVPKNVNTINGTVPPGEVAGLVDVTTMLDTIDGNGNQIVVTKGTRKAGTRVKIHIHEHGGHTCVLTGEITDFIEGQEPKKFPAGTCYYMPPNVPMSAANLGTVDAVLIDNFIVPKGEPTITILEHSH